MNQKMELDKPTRFWQAIYWWLIGFSTFQSCTAVSTRTWLGIAQGCHLSWACLLAGHTPNIWAKWQRKKNYQQPRGLYLINI
jgi:hypothetical protein